MARFWMLTVLLFVFNPVYADDGAELLERRALVSKEAAAARHDEVFGQLPEPKDIVRMTAEVHWVVYSPKTALPKFEVPKSNFADILKEFHGGKIDRSPILSLPEHGTICITDDAGCLRRICWYGGVKGPLLFSINGVRCTIAPDFVNGQVVPKGDLDKQLKRAYEASQANKNQEN